MLISSNRLQISLNIYSFHVRFGELNIVLDFKRIWSSNKKTFKMEVTFINDHKFLLYTCCSLKWFTVDFDKIRLGIDSKWQPLFWAKDSISMGSLQL